MITVPVTLWQLLWMSGRTVLLFLLRVSKCSSMKGSRRYRLWCPILRENMFTEVLPVRLIGYFTVFPTFI